MSGVYSWTDQWPHLGRALNISRHKYVKVLFCLLFLFRGIESTKVFHAQPVHSLFLDSILKIKERTLFDTFIYMQNSAPFMRYEKLVRQKPDYIYFHYKILHYIKQQRHKKTLKKTKIFGQQMCFFFFPLSLKYTPCFKSFTAENMKRFQVIDISFWLSQRKVVLILFFFFLGK